MSNKKNSGGPLIHIATPLIAAAMCIGIFMIAMIKPSDKLKVYKNLIFMDELKMDPEDEGIGLKIKDNQIIDDYAGQTSDTGEFIRPVYGEMYAVLKSSAMDLSVPVYWGSDIELFERGACQATGSVIIGDEGNTVISAHEDTFFAQLSELNIGDTVTLSTNYGEFTYTVRELISFKKDNNKYVNPTEDTRLTLYTCKKNVLGSSDERIGVICDLTDKKFYVNAKEEN
ncbi:MAG: class D sortase [Ruminococcus sp.]|jgi:sortase A|nr:class D sortase [Ruminococcus sp.]